MPGPGPVTLLEFGTKSDTPNQKRPRPANIYVSLLRRIVLQKEILAGKHFSLLSGVWNGQFFKKLLEVCRACRRTMPRTRGLIHPEKLAEIIFRILNCPTNLNLNHRISSSLIRKGRIPDQFRAQLNHSLRDQQPELPTQFSCPVHRKITL